MARRRQPCGTVAGHFRHRYRHEEPCGPCREAERTREQNRRRTTKASRTSGRELQPCGTDAGYQRHYRRNEQPCPDCAAARRSANARYLKRREAC